MKTICLYTKNPNPSGISVILNNIKRKMHDVNIPIVTELHDALKFDVILPYGLLEPIDILKADKSKCSISLMIDATSLINLSQYRYYNKKDIVSIKEKALELMRYYYHLYLEKKVFQIYDDVILVSYGDKRYFESIPGINKYASKISVVQNGVVLPQTFKRNRKKDGKIVLGFLRSWGDGNSPMPIAERCFLEYTWKSVQKINNNIQLLLCGKGMSPMQKKYCEKYDNVVCVGEVDSLSDYFDNIDINIMIMPKHGGLLNKMLDGFAYKCPTIGEAHNFVAFNNIPDCYYTYHDSYSLVASVERIMNNRPEAAEKAELAFQYVRENHDWDKNYDSLVQKIYNLLY